MNLIFIDLPVGDWLVNIISWLVETCSSVALGVILFTVILKLITLPFDYASRASMRKNSLKMEEMRPELEKLQEQCAGNKELYNQKMMALYKKNGYSMFGACLPTILTLVIFIVALNGFQAYSVYQNKMYFYDMSKSYNQVVYSGFELDEQGDKLIYVNENGKFVIDDQKCYDKLNGGEVAEAKGKDGAGNEFTINIRKTIEGTINYLEVDTQNGYSIYRKTFTVDGNGKVTFAEKEEAYLVKLENILSKKLAKEENNFLVNSLGEYAVAETEAFNKQAEIEYEKAFNQAFDTAKKADANLTKENFKATFDAQNPNFIDNWKVQNEAEFKKNYPVKFMQDIQQTMSAEKFREVKEGFLWVKNIWVSDSPMNHPVSGNPRDVGLETNTEAYYDLVAKLDVEKTEPNGYFILVALTAISSFVMQFVMSKAQKAQMELQTVDGQGAQTQKIMMWMMPIMMAIFAFSYTAAFSIYIILSSVISIGTTFLINFIVDLQMKKASKGKNDQNVYGRVYLPKPEEKKAEPKKAKKKKDDKFAHENGGDFLTSQRKHYRGRMK